MLDVPTVERVPLERTKEGVIRIIGTRIPLATVIIAYKSGASAEAIAESFTKLALADIHSIITYYLRHQSEVEAYLQEQQKLAKEIREEVEKRFPPDEIKERLLARWALKK